MLEGVLLPKVAGHRTSAGQLCQLATKFQLTQLVNLATRGAEILDLIWSSDPDLVTNIQVEHFPSITDHNIVTATTSFKVSKEVFKERNFLLESGRRFHQLDLSKAPWSEIKRRLGNIDWGEMETLAKTDVVAAHTHLKLYYLFWRNLSPMK